LNQVARIFGGELWHALRNLMPILLVVGGFQLFILRQAPDDLATILLGLGIVVIGIATFLQGLELGVFPIGKNLANDFARKGSIAWLTLFGFCLGTATVIAEPALIAVAEQAESISEGRIQSLTLRLLVAFSVGFVVALGVIRIALGHSIVWYMVIGYTLVVSITFFAPAEIVGLAYDSGGVTTNIVTVPLIAALGMGLASSIRGRSTLTDGFGLVALAVMVPMITVQLYGILVYSGGGEAGFEASPEALAGADIDEVPATVTGMLGDLFRMLGDVLPIIAVVLIFQYLVLRKPVAHLHKVVFGFVMVILGLYAFVVGLKLGLFPVGAGMAEQLIERDVVFFIYLFAFLIGWATTMAEPALIAVGKKAAEAARGKLDGATIRNLVALGVAIGITIGVHRLISGGSMHYYIIGGYSLVLLLTLLAPKYIVALAFDLGGVTTSEVTVPLITALGIGLATRIEGRDPLIDGFGLIAFASIFPIVTVMLYAITVEFIIRRRARAAGSPE